MALNKAWRDKAGSGTQYEADSSDPSDNTPVDAAGMRDLESRAAAAITAAVAAEATARATNDTALNAAFAAGLAGRAPLSTNAGDAGKAIDAYTGQPLPLPAQSGSSAVGNCLWNGSAWTYSGAVITARPNFAGKLIWLGGGADQDPTPAGLGYAANGDLWIPSEVVE